MEAFADSNTPPSPRRLLTEERRREILRLLKEKGSVTVDNLRSHFRVSAVTLRADLGELTRMGLAIRGYGGATLPQEARQDFPLRVKGSIHHQEKARIGRAAAQLVAANQRVILDSGTTSAEVAKAIKQSDPQALTVITHALNIAEVFVDSPNISVIMLGGVMRHMSASFVGPQAERLISELRADHFFLGVDGIDAEFGLSTPDLLEAQLNRMMIDVAEEVTIVADSSKLGRRSLSTIADIGRARRLITDDRADESAINLLREKGLFVELV